MYVTASNLAWDELLHRASFQLATFSPPHQPDARSSCRLWRWPTFRTYVTWALFELNDGDYLVRGRWDSREAVDIVGASNIMPAPAMALHPRVFLHTIRLPAGLLGRIQDSLRVHLDGTTGGAGIDGIHYGFEIAEGDQVHRVDWWSSYIPKQTFEAFASWTATLDALFE